MKTYVLDSANFSDESRFYDSVSEIFGFFPDFWKNLDALWDCLSDSSAEEAGVSLARFEKPCEVVWKESPNCGLPQDFKDCVFEIFSQVDALHFRVE